MELLVVCCIASYYAFMHVIL